MKLRNPWLTGTHYFGIAQQTCDAKDRIECVKQMGPDELRDVLAWPDKQKAVRDAAERRLRKLTANCAAILLAVALGLSGCATRHATEARYPFPVMVDPVTETIPEVIEP